MKNKEPGVKRQHMYGNNAVSQHNGYLNHDYEHILLIIISDIRDRFNIQ